MMAGMKMMRKERFMGVRRIALLAGPVSRQARVRLPDSYLRDPRARRELRQQPQRFIVEVLRHVFSRGVYRSKRFQVVQELVIERLDDLAQRRLQMEEIGEQPDGIELRAFHGYPHAIVVPVRILALALVPAQCVARRKRLFHADVKHLSPVKTPASQVPREVGCSAARNREISAMSRVIP